MTKDRWHRFSKKCTFVFIYDVYIDVLRKRKGMFVLAKFIVHTRSFPYVWYFFPSWYHSQASIIGYYFCNFLLLEIVHHLLSPSTCWSLFIRPLPKPLPFPELFVRLYLQHFVFCFFCPKSSFCFFSCRDPPLQNTWSAEQNWAVGVTPLEDVSKT